jgi:hypothetical protein
MLMKHCHLLVRCRCMSHIDWVVTKWVGDGGLYLRAKPEKQDWGGRMGLKSAPLAMTRYVCSTHKNISSCLEDIQPTRAFQCTSGPDTASPYVQD